MLVLKSYLSKYSLSEYKSGFLYIFSSKVLIAFITFCSTPILSRIFSPADYGLFALVNSVIAILALFSNLTLPVSLLVTEDKDLSDKVQGIFGYALMVNVAFVVCGLLFSTVSVRNTFLTIEIVLLCGLSSLLLTASQILANMNIREKAFKKNVVVNIMENFSLRTAGLSYGLLGFTHLGLLYAEATGRIVNIITQFSYRRIHIPEIKVARVVSFKNILHTIRQNKDYAFFNLPVSLIGAFYNQAILWVVAIIFSTESLGQFTMALGLLSIPLTMLANSFQPLVTKKVFEESDSFDVRSFSSLAAKIGMISIVVYAMIYLLSPWFVGLYLGEKWLGSIPFIQWLCIPFAIQLLGSSMGGIFIVLHKQKVNFVIKVISLILFSVFLLVQAGSGLELHRIVILYGLVISFEEVTKIVYIKNHLKNVRRK